MGVKSSLDWFHNLSKEEQRWIIFFGILSILSIAYAVLVYGMNITSPRILKPYGPAVYEIQILEVSYGDIEIWIYLSLEQVLRFSLLGVFIPIGISIVAMYSIRKRMCRREVLIHVISTVMILIMFGLFPDIREYEDICGIAPGIPAIIGLLLIQISVLYINRDETQISTSLGNYSSAFVGILLGDIYVTCTVLSFRGIIGGALLADGLVFIPILLFFFSFAKTYIVNGVEFLKSRFLGRTHRLILSTKTNYGNVT